MSCELQQPEVTYLPKRCLLQVDLETLPVQRGNHLHRWQVRLSQAGIFQQDSFDRPCAIQWCSLRENRQWNQHHKQQTFKEIWAEAYVLATQSRDSTIYIYNQNHDKTSKNRTCQYVWDGSLPIQKHRDSKFTISVPIEWLDLFESYTTRI